jgi:hypothetical protein
MLLVMCRDDEEKVLKSAFFAICTIRTEARQIGFDPSSPTEAALASLAKLLEG